MLDTPLQGQQWSDIRVTGVRIEHPFISDFKKHLDILWDDPPQQANVVGFNIYRTNEYSVEQKNYEKLNQEPIIVNFFRDSNLFVRPWNNLFYVVLAVKFDGEESPFSKATPTSYAPTATGWDGRMAYILQEVIRRDQLMVEANGEVGTIFILKRFGKRCSCYNPYKATSETSRCPDCYGTSYEGGFSKVAETMFRVRSEQETIRPDRYGLVIQYTPIIWVPGPLPPLHRGDLFLRNNNTMFHVEQVRHRQTAGVITIQMAGTTELDSTSPYHGLIGK